ncbi:MAG: hypothetical protein HC923_11715 [Myxococcales bacterium]|nr:hypothetical protein [Myxococcales bacterium]
MPSWRVDLKAEVDLIEEVARVGGYESIPVIMPPLASKVRTVAFQPRFERNLREGLIGLGFRETVSLGFSSERDAELFGHAKASLVEVQNPLGEETRYLRFSLIPALLVAARRNQDALPSLTDLRFFEIGGTFAWSPQSIDAPRERRRLALLLRGRRRPAGWSSSEEMLDIYDLLGALELVWERLGRTLPVPARDDTPWLHPRTEGRIVDDGEPVGVFGELHPDLMRAYGLEGPAPIVAEIDLAGLSTQVALPAFRTPVSHPPAQRDLSFFVKKERLAAAILETVRDAGKAVNLESVELFDVFEGRGVPEDERSIAIALVFRATDHTMDEAEVEASQKHILEALVREHAVRLRAG